MIMLLCKQVEAAVRFGFGSNCKLHIKVETKDVKAIKKQEF